MMDMSLSKLQELVMDREAWHPKLMTDVKSLSKLIAKKIATTGYRWSRPRKYFILNTQIRKEK